MTMRSRVYSRRVDANAPESPGTLPRTPAEKQTPSGKQMTDGKPSAGDPSAKRTVPQNPTNLQVHIGPNGVTVTTG